MLSQPLLRRLKERRVHADIDVFAPAWVAPVYRLMPEVARVIDNPFKHGELRLLARRRFGRELSAAHYGQAIVLPNSAKSALLPFFARIAKRTGFIGEMRRGLLNDARALDEADLPLMVERFAYLAEPLGAPLQRPLPHPRLVVDERARRATLEKLDLSEAGALAIFCPGAEYGPAKRWPARHFSTLARGLREAGYTVCLLGSNKDRAVGETVAELAGKACRNLCGSTTLEEAIHLIAGARLVVSNDSGLMHVAAALDRRLVALFGSSSPRFTPPLSDRATVLRLDLSCSPCFSRECPLGHFDCMNNLLPETVLSAALGGAA